MNAPQQTTDSSPKGSKLSNFCIDATLVLLVAGVLAGTAHYLKTQLELYRVPSQLEILSEENAQLTQQLVDLEQKAFPADENLQLSLHLRKLKEKQREVNEQIAQKKENAQQLAQEILAQQYEILQEDKQSRSLARNQLLPGMPLGRVSTIKGKVYDGASARSISNGRMVLRHDSGSATVVLKELSMDSLPPLARYALGKEELVDTSDFESTTAILNKSADERPLAGLPETKPEKLSVPKPLPYEPQSSGPVIDTQSPAPGAQPSQVPSLLPAERWVGPEGDLPI